MLRLAGFIDVEVNMKEESKEFIKDWMPGSGCENFIVSAQVIAYKPLHDNITQSVTAPEAEKGG